MSICFTDYEVLKTLLSSIYTGDTLITKQGFIDC